MSQWAAQLEYEDVHEAFLLNNDPEGTPAGQCFEITIGTAPAPVLWAAYNPHSTKTVTTRGHYLDFEQLVVQVDNADVAMMEPEGGTDLSGSTGPHAADLQTTFETDTLTGYTANVPIAVLLGCGTVAEDEKTITEDSTWQDLGGFVMGLAFFADDVSDCVIRGFGQVKTQGVEAQLRIVRVSDSTVLMTSPYEPGNLSGAWSEMKFITDVALTSDTETYRLEGRLNGASSASIRCTSLFIIQTG